MRNPNETTASKTIISPEALAAMGAHNTVYIREVAAADLEAEGAVPEGMVLPKDTKLYAVYSAMGIRMAVLDDRERAFASARMYEMEPVSVH